MCVRAEIWETGEKWLLLTSNLSAPDQFRKPRLMSPDSCGTKAAWKLSERKACYSGAAYQTLQMEEKPYLQRRLRFAPSTQQVSRSLRLLLELPIDSKSYYIAKDSNHQTTWPTLNKKIHPLSPAMFEMTMVWIQTPSLVLTVKLCWYLENGNCSTTCPWNKCASTCFYPSPPGL